MAEEFCNGKHSLECYENGVSKHIHKDYRSRTSTSSIQYTRGGCYNKYHAGYYDYRICNGDMVINGATMTYGGSNYPCGCNNNLYYLQYGGVSVNRARLQSVSYNSDGYTEYYVGECSRCGGTAYVYYNYIYGYRCTVCNRSFSSRGSHTITISSPAYYEADCGKNTNEYYYDGGDGKKAEPICDKTVVDLIPQESRQICVFDGECAVINREAVAVFKDGHIETVTCALEEVNNTLFNTWQYIKLGYGGYHIENGEIVRGNERVLVSLYIQGLVKVKLGSSNEAMGEPGFENGEKCREYLIGTEVRINANPKTGYHVKLWLNHEGQVIRDSEKALSINYKVPDYETEITCLYEPDVYTVTFDAAGGEFSNGNRVISKSCVFSNVYGKVEEPVKSGFRFMGWKYADETYGSDLISAEYTCLSVPGNHTLVAVWSEDGPKYTFISYDDTFENLYIPERKGYDFLGWYLEEEGQNGFGLKADELLPLKYEYEYEGCLIEKDRNNYVIYAGWEAQKYNIVFQCEDNTYLRSSERIVDDEGHEIQYHVIKSGSSFDSDSAVKQVTYDGVYGDLPQPGMLDSNMVGMDEYIFVGWSVDGTSDGMIFSYMTVNIEHDIIVRPIFTKVGEYEVSLDANGGAMHEAFSIGIVSNPFEITVGSVYGKTLGYYPMYEGRSFVGWNSRRDGLGNRINTTTKVYEANNHTLYAKWERYIKYDSNRVDITGNSLVGAVTGSMGKHIFVNDDESPQAVKKNGFYRSYYKFVGWNTERDGSGIWYCSPEDMGTETPEKALTSITPGSEATMILYAQWDSRISIELNYCGGDYEGESCTFIDVKMGMTLPNKVDMIPQKDGFWFKGFYTGTNGSGVCVYDKRGRYCYKEQSAKQVGGIIIMCPENSVLIGEVFDSVLKSDTRVSWPEIDRLYACWEEGEEPMNVEIIDSGLIRINNEPIKEYDEAGIPIAHLGNKIEFFLRIISPVYPKEDLAVSASFEFFGDNDERLRAFSTIGKEDYIITFGEIGKDILAPAVYDSDYCSRDNQELLYECPFVLPYLTYFVDENNMDTFNRAAEKNTLSGYENFFYKGKVWIVIHIQLIAEGEETDTVEKLTFRINN